LGLVWVIFTLLATVAVCYAVNQVLSPRPLDQTIAVSSPSPAPAGNPDVSHQLTGRPAGSGRATSDGTVRRPAGSSTGTRSSAKPPAKPEAATHPLSGESPGVDPDRGGGQTEFGNEPSDPPSQYVTQPTRHVDGQHGSVTFTYQDGKMGIQDPKPDRGYSASVTNLQAQKAVVKFTGNSTTETILAQVSDAGGWSIDITEAS
jgi:hypothetical protein